jgi:hypothetical protein
MRFARTNRILPGKRTQQPSSGNDCLHQRKHIFKPVSVPVFSSASNDRANTLGVSADRDDFFVVDLEDATAVVESPIFDLRDFFFFVVLVDDILCFTVSD